MKIKVVLPAVNIDSVATAMLTLSEALAKLRPDTQSGGLLGGEFGYGNDFENDEFMMRAYCWCEKEGECPWCTGCAIYGDTCVACKAGSTHTESCYQTHLRTAEKAAGLSRNRKLPYEQRRQIKDTIYDRLCAEHGLDRSLGAAVHCDCVARTERERLLSLGSGCDYHNGAGIFAKFSQWTLDHKTGYYDPPNFWHKPSNFRVIWYKYIGRDMKTNRPIKSIELDSIAGMCLASLIEKPPAG